MKTISKTLFCALAVALFTGCAATCPLGDAAFGAGGAYIANQLSDGNPVATAAGAAGGVLLSEGLHYAAGKEAQKAYATGYDKGKSDAVKAAALALRVHPEEGAKPGRQRPALPRAAAGT